MEERKTRIRRHVSVKQKKNLVQFITEHPELITGRGPQGFGHLQRLWQVVANQCNALPGARKTWRQWRKTWQDLRSKTKKRQEKINGALPGSVVMLTPEEQQVLGLKNVESAPYHERNTVNEHQENTEFVPLEQESIDSNFLLEMETAGSPSESESLPEVKVFTQTECERESPKARKYTTNNTKPSKHSKNCEFNCERLSKLESKKVALKEDYLRFKKDYLRQKLKLIRQQTEALKTIAKELSD